MSKGRFKRLAAKFKASENEKNEKIATLRCDVGFVV
jgi:hypothetical protein